jgi:hypothetical protein
MKRRNGQSYSQRIITPEGNGGAGCQRYEKKETPYLRSLRAKIQQLSNDQLGMSVGLNTMLVQEVLSYIRHNGTQSVPNLAKLFQTSQVVMERIGRCLLKHGLVVQGVSSRGDLTYGCSSSG